MKKRSLKRRWIPVVDIEFYGDKFINPPEDEVIVRELKTMLDIPVQRNILI